MNSKEDKKLKKIKIKGRNIAKNVAISSFVISNNVSEKVQDVSKNVKKGSEKISNTTSKVLKSGADSVQKTSTQVKKHSTNIYEVVKENPEEVFKGALETSIISAPLAAKAGGVVGAKIGIIGGPVGSAVGAGVGIAAGVGLSVYSASRRKKEEKDKTLDDSIKGAKKMYEDSEQSIIEIKKLFSKTKNKI
ncbi:MAG: hypothetical protein FWE02_01485 [Defluviitaleaceae bacterium]|nr:hypothetical protein [Defluviitaleaceae bacterium]